MSRPKGSAKPPGSGRQAGTPNKKGVKPRKPVNQTILIQAPARIETPEEKLAEIERVRRWENSEAGRREVSADEQRRRDSALAARYVNRPAEHVAPPPSKKPTESLQPRNTQSYRGASADVARSYQDYLRRITGGGPSFGWSPFDK